MVYELPMNGRALVGLSVKLATGLFVQETEALATASSSFCRPSPFVSA
jgi:hypothetical protein